MKLRKIEKFIIFCGCFYIVWQLLNPPFYDKSIRYWPIFEGDGKIDVFRLCLQILGTAGATLLLAYAVRSVLNNIKISIIVSLVVIALALCGASLYFLLADEGEKAQTIDEVYGPFPAVQNAQSFNIENIPVAPNIVETQPAPATKK